MIANIPSKNECVINTGDKHYSSLPPRGHIACSRLSISGSERKQRRAKNQAIQGERAGAGAPSSLPRPSSLFPRSPAARRTDPLTEGLEQARGHKPAKGKSSSFEIT